MNMVKSESERYIAIPNALFKDKRLTWEAIGIYATLCSIPDGEDVTMETIYNLCPKDSREVVDSALKTLEKCGYVVIHEPFALEIVDIS